MSKTVKAVTIVKPGCLELREYLVPECPKNGLILNIEINDEANTPESLKKLMELIEKIFDREL